MLELKCAICRVQACSQEPGTARYPDFCPMSSENQPAGREALARARDQYQRAEIRDIALAAARTEADRYPLETRVEEVMSFARRIGARRLGIASCVGLIREAGMLHEILASNEFEVASVACKVGSIPKEEVGLADAEKIRPGSFEALCNPIGQAMLLNQAETELNIVVGLCVGHDTLFFQHSEAPVTVLVAKDRVTGHNPAAVLYTSHSYYRRIKGGKG